MIPAANTSTHPDYNNLFEKLVIETRPKSKERLIGMLAYADYKEEKYSWKESYRVQHSVEVVPADTVKSFLLSYNDARLNKLRSDAEETLYIFAENYAQESNRIARHDALNEGILNSIKSHNKQLLDDVNSSTNDVMKVVASGYDSWLKSIFKNVISSVVFAFIAVAISVILSISNPDTNYGKLVQIIIGNRDLIILTPDDCRLKNVSKNCRE